MITCSQTSILLSTYRRCCSYHPYNAYPPTATDNIFLSHRCVADLWVPITLVKCVKLPHSTQIILLQTNNIQVLAAIRREW